MKRKLLWIKDSYGMPITTMSSTVFESVDVIDPRTYNEADLCGYILATKPDAVVVVFNVAGDLHPKSSVWQTKNYCNSSFYSWQSICTKVSATIRAPENRERYYWKAFEFTADSDSIYRILVNEIVVLSGSVNAVTIAVQNVDAKKEIYLDTFSVPFLKESNKPIVFPFGFLTEGKVYRVLVYAGERGKTSGCILNVRGLSVERLEIELGKECR